ncbi:AraC-like DNA-binding protein [Phyllobacterium trifolii]|uniref:AraC-like DNA-binding protein n=1 Tax=Phyllobacterium trifolii TaxID=300193 RepID=A0A839UHV4_9HYPH|nr:AraC family transcriptional regulator [Phyllobacterium trifolii]MBB3148129.1 AraC-like DNA-binding protein [Phyllobacterium trifolii]
MGKTLLTGNKKTRGRAYGSQLGERLGLPKPPSHVYRTLNRGTLAITELQSRAPPRDPTPSFGHDDAYQVIVSLRHIRLQLWLNDSYHLSDMHGGKTYIADLRQEPRVLIQNPFHTVNFYMPISTLKAYSEQNDMPIFTDFPQPPTVGQDDPVMRQLAGAASAAFAYRHQASGLLLDAVLDAVCANMLGRYGASTSTASARSRGLAPWQERRAKELMDEHLDVSMSKLAEECGLSVAHFGRAFKNSTGTAPHQWQLGRRMKRAQALLTGSSLSISEVALECGFSSQSHFTTAFRETIGVSPGQWRRSGSTGISGLDTD